MTSAFQMRSGTPVRFSHGVTNVPKDHMFARMRTTVPTLYHTYFNDFDAFASGDWTTTTTGTGATTQPNADGGAILLTNSAANGDAIFHQKKGESFLMEQYRRCFFEANFTVSDATNSAWVMGLQVTDTTPLDVTDGIYFLKSSGSTAISFITGKDATTGRLTTSNVATNSAAGTFMKLGFEFDGKQYITIWKDGVEIATADLTTSLTFLPDTTLTISFGVQNGAAAAKTMTVDYIYASKER